MSFSQTHFGYLWRKKNINTIIRFWQWWVGLLVLVTLHTVKSKFAWTRRKGDLLFSKWRLLCGVFYLLSNTPKLYENFHIDLSLAFYKRKRLKQNDAYLQLFDKHIREFFWKKNGETNKAKSFWKLLDMAFAMTILWRLQRHFSTN